MSVTNSGAVTVCVVVTVTGVPVPSEHLAGPVAVASWSGAAGRSPLGRADVGERRLAQRLRRCSRDRARAAGRCRADVSAPGAAGALIERLVLVPTKTPASALRCCCIGRRWGTGASARARWPAACRWRCRVTMLRRGRQSSVMKLVEHGVVARPVAGVAVEGLEIDARVRLGRHVGIAGVGQPVAVGVDGRRVGVVGADVAGVGAAVGVLVGRTADAAGHVGRRSNAGEIGAGRNRHVVAWRRDRQRRQMHGHPVAAAGSSPAASSSRWRRDVAGRRRHRPAR